MKKTLTMALGLAVIASAAFAEPTYSKNAVGFINIPATGGQLYALTVPLDNMDADNGIWKFEDTQIAKDADDGSSVYFWTGTRWAEYVKGRDGFGIDEAYEALTPGQCFFFQPSSDMMLTMSGQVPDSSNTVVKVTGAKNLSAIGNPYPVQFKFEESQLAQDASDGASVYFWTGTRWAEYVKGRDGFGVDEAFEFVTPGQGFFFQTTDDDSESEWKVEKEYKYP